MTRGPDDAGADYPSGKSKGNSDIYFCDFFDIADHLHAGKNIVAVEVFTDRLGD